MKKLSILAETSLLFLALAFLIPLPNSSAQHYPIFPAIIFAMTPFFVSRLIRHGVVGWKPLRVKIGLLVYAVIETGAFGALFVILQSAAKMLV